MLIGEYKEAEKLNEVLTILGLKPSKDTSIGSVGLKSYYISNGNGKLFCVRIWLDGRSGQGTVKVRLSDNGHGNRHNEDFSSS